MRIYLLILFLYSSLYSLAQQPSYFRLGERELEGVDIYDVIQDFEFNYWFATDQGIFKHDGYTFKKIESDALGKGSVFNLVMNSHGTIFCTNLNRQVFQLKKDQCKLIFTIPSNSTDVSLTVNQKDQLLINAARSVFVLDRSNRLIYSSKKRSDIYLATAFELKSGKMAFHNGSTHSLFIYDDKNLDSVRIGIDRTSERSVSQTFYFFRLGEDAYAADYEGNDIFRFNENTMTLTHLLSVKGKLQSESVRYYSTRENFWVASNISGIMQFSKSEHSLKGGTKYFEDYLISDVFQDREGNLLLSTFDQGVIVIPDLNVQDIEPMLKPYVITQFFVEGNVLFLGTRKGQILQFDQQLEEIYSQGHLGIEVLSKWPDKSIVLHNDNGFAHINLKTKFQKNWNGKFGSLKDVIYLDDETYMAAFNMGVQEFRFNEQSNEITLLKSHFQGRAYEIEYEKKSGTTYFSTLEGLKYLDAQGNRHAILLNNKKILASSIYNHGDVTYVATQTSGLLVLQKGRIIRSIQPTHDNEALLIRKMLIHQQRIYANTQFGLLVLNKKGEIQCHLDRSCGLSTNKVIDFCVYRKELWVTHSRGVQHFKISDIIAKINPPSIIFSKILVNNASVDKRRVGDFSSDQNKFQVLLLVPTLKHRETIKYHYRLEGNDDSWRVNTYDQREILYNALGPGNYRFAVKAESNGVFSAPIYYSFTISAPFYQKTWFIVLIAFGTLILSTLVYRRLLNLQKKKAKRVNELNASRLTAIQSQMNPHFIFNSLNSIQDLVLKGDVENSYTFIAKFSNLVRRTLNYSDKDFIEFEKELKLIKLYLSLEKLRFKEELNYTISVEVPDEILVPPMLIQPFIENALVHGLLHKDGLKALDITFHLGTTLVCTITDNGVGRKKAKEIKERQRADHESFAMNAIKKRFEILEAHFNGELGYAFEDLMRGEEIIGTQVTLKIPFRQKF